MSTIESTTITDETIPGLSYNVGIVPDEDAGRPEDNGDGYTPKQVKAWEDNDWSYVGIVITPVYGGTALDDYSGSLWGVEYGRFVCTDEDDNVTENTTLDLASIVDSHVKDMLGEVKHDMAKALPVTVGKLSALAQALENGI